MVEFSEKTCQALFSVFSLQRGYAAACTGLLRSYENVSKVVEMGANIGFFTIIGAFANKNLKYTSIEANPRTGEFLKSNIKLNALDHVEIIVAAVVGEKKEEFTELYIPLEENAESAPTGAYIGGGESISRTSMQSINVNLIPAIEVVGNADIIKLDIEGYEFIVLNSILSEIVVLRPLIWVEVRRNTHDLRGLLSNLSSENEYKIFAIGENKLEEVSAVDIKSVVLQESFNTRDVVVVPLEKLSIISSYNA